MQKEKQTIKTIIQLKVIYWSLLSIMTLDCKFESEFIYSFEGYYFDINWL